MKKTVIAVVLCLACVVTSAFYYLWTDSKKENEIIIPLLVTETNTETLSNQSNTSADEMKNYKFDLNTADYEQLQKIGGIGPVIAERIIEYRDNNGKFRSVSDLLSVNGIGEAKLDLIRQFVFVEPDNTSESDYAVYAIATMPDTINTEKNIVEPAETTVPYSELLELYAEEETLCTDDWQGLENEWGETETAYCEMEESEYQCELYFPLELNNVTKEQLEMVDGIGERTAERIVLYAQVNGFYSVEDLMKVPGIGKVTYDKIKGYFYADSSGLPEKEVNSDNLTSITEYVPNLPIELNSAEIEDLMWLDGIGQTLAMRIIIYAQTKGFYSVDDLQYVSGIGNAKLENIRKYLSVDSSSLPPKPEETVPSSDTATLSDTTAQTEPQLVYPRTLDTGTCSDEEIKNNIAAILETEDNEKMSLVMDYIVAVRQGNKAITSQEIFAICYEFFGKKVINQEKADKFDVYFVVS